MVYVVSYDLRQARRNYSGLIEELRKSPSWWHFMESTWLISTSENADQVFARVKPHVDDDDYLLIVQARRPYQGWLPKEAWDWINQQVVF